MIYCVEDDAGIRELVVYTLQNTGMEARGLEDGSALSAALREKKPQLILLDIMLPGEDGISILRRLRSTQETAGIPVILLTAKNCCRDQLRCWWRRQRIDMDMIPEPAMQENEASELLEILLSLPEKHRIPLYLHCIEGYPAKELTSLLGCRESTVRTRLQRGREMLKQRLGGIIDDDEKNTANARSNRAAKAVDAARHSGEA